MTSKSFSRQSTLLLFFVLFFCFQAKINAQESEMTIDPPFWWAEMNNQNLQLMVHSKNIGLQTVQVNYPGVSLEKTTPTDNPNYLFIDLKISSKAKPGTIDLRFFEKGKLTKVFPYTLNKRREGSSKRNGFNSSDAIYLIMPDRFANGNPKNDEIPGMLEKPNRNAPYGRHGGDLEGIMDHLDYIQNLGMTAIWLNPVLENDMPVSSYHGYAITDFYNVDKRLGGNEVYLKLVKKAHENNMKIIMDMIFNHFGTGSIWSKDMPMKDWANQFPEFTRSNYRSSVLSDPHASKNDINLMQRGWFDLTMADFNQQNPFVANYLIQNSIWWIEYADLDGIRLDTYPYSDKMFMCKWMQRVHEEYPNFNVVGEVWLNTPPQVAYWQKDAPNKDGFNSNLDYVFDFPLKFATNKAFNEKDGWDGGVSQLYGVLCQDFLYADPNRIINFLDNHDVDRAFSTAEKNLDKLKMMATVVATVRGGAQFYYGTELLMTGHEHKGHSTLRSDFPGGWKNDSINAFTETGRNDYQNNFISYLRLLLNYRKNHSVLHNGKMTHFIPEDGIYVYFRHNDDESVMVVFNNNDDVKTIQTKRYSEMLENYKTGSDILRRTYFETLDSIQMPAKSARVIELKK